MYIIEGNIGAGKSTFLKLVQKYIPTVSVALEPLQNWQDLECGQSLLTQFYQNPQRWAYTLETLTLMSRVREQMYQQAQKANNLLVERSIYSGYYCFAQNCYEQGFITKVEWEIYSQWFNFLLSNKCTPPQGFIYLRIDPEIAHQRIQKRSRAGEETISLQYLQQVHEKHEAFLLRKENVLSQLVKVPVLVLDCNEDFEKNATKLEELLHAVENFLKATHPLYKPAVIDQDRSNAWLIQNTLFKNSDAF